MCTTTDAAAIPTDRPLARRDYEFALLNGVLGQIGLAFMHPELVIVGMVYVIAPEAWTKATVLYLVALVTVVSKAGMLAPQIVMGVFMEHRSRRKPTYRVMVYVRAAAYAAMIVSIALIALDVISPAYVFVLFFLAYLAVCVSGGLSNVLYTDMLARVIPLGRMGRFLGLRSFLGGGLGAVVGFFVLQPLVSTLVAPVNYLCAVTLGAACGIAAMIFFLQVYETDGPRAKERSTVGESLRRGFEWVRTDHNYRLYLLQRLAFRVNYLGLAFFIPYGIQNLTVSGSKAEMVALTGILVATERVSRVVTALFWGKVADRHEFRRCFVGAGVGFVLLAVLALAAPRLPEVFAVPIPLTDAVLTLRMCVYLLALAAWGAGVQASMIGGNRFYIGSAPPHRRMSYMGFLNTVTSPLTLLPLAGAALAARFGTEAVFLVVGVSALFYLVNALRFIPEHKAVARRDSLVNDEFHSVPDNETNP